MCFCHIIVLKRQSVEGLEEGERAGGREGEKRGGGEGR